MTTTPEQSAQSPALIHPNEYEGKHRPNLVAGHSWAPTEDYGPAPVVPAGVGISLASRPHLTLTDMTGGMVEVELSPEDVEHIVAAALVHRAVFEQKRAELESAEIEACNERQNAFFRTHPRSEATS